MGKYSNAGKQVLYTSGYGADIKQVHICDAESNEMAHSIAYHMNSKSSNYIENAKRTLSPSWHGNKVAKAQFIGRINLAIDAANKLDALKKTLFYGRDNNLISEGQSDVSALPTRIDCGDSSAVNIIHAILGKFTEAGELLEALRNAYNGKGGDHTFDKVNAKEEVGDGFWYDAILADECDFMFEEAMSININKLRSRFPDKFAEVNANERNLAAERAILEDRAAPLALDEPIKETEWLPPGAVLDENGGDYAPIETNYANQPLIVPSVPASGPVAVTKAAELSAQAFDNVGNVPAKVDPEVSDLGGELAKSPAERITPLPQESMAHINSGEFDEK